MSSETFEERIERAVKDREIPGAIFAAGDVERKLYYAKAFGHRSLKDPSNPEPLTLDATMWFASCTKLITTVAIMQFVERGQLSPDDDVTVILPELKGRKILTGFDETTDEPILIENTKTITLRQLLTHSSGLSYSTMHPHLAKYRLKNGRSLGFFIKDTVPVFYDDPLIAVPGEAWHYSPGLDWAGLIVERLSSMTLDDYANKNVWHPLGVTSMTFHINKTPAILEKHADMSMRSGGRTDWGAAMDPEGIVQYTDDTICNKDVPDCQGGIGGFGSPADYQKLLHSLVSDDEKLLKKGTVDVMFEDQLTLESKKSLNEKVSIPFVNEIFGRIPPGVDTTFGLGGLVYLTDVPGGRRSGSMSWGGLPNLLWLIDRKAGISTILGCQLIPSGDSKINTLFQEWQQYLYKRAGKTSPKFTG